MYPNRRFPLFSHMYLVSFALRNTCLFLTLFVIKATWIHVSSDRLMVVAAIRFAPRNPQLTRERVLNSNGGQPTDDFPCTRRTTVTRPFSIVRTVVALRDGGWDAENKRNVFVPKEKSARSNRWLRTENKNKSKCLRNTQVPNGKTRRFLKDFSVENPISSLVTVWMEFDDKTIKQCYPVYI